MTGEGYRVGIGYDIHPLAEGRDLILGGVEIEYHKGLDGHSDADVLSHAVGDALLGAANLEDLGRHFPESEEFRGISSLIILEKISELISNAGFKIVNIDSIVNAENPRLASCRPEMTDNIARSLEIDRSAVSVKFTRGEGMGEVGRGKAMEARAVVLLKKE
ncbi:MAG TPA: 2-C-methyl-D-erythritol 2,4-cyclodiphosphate synthase [Candidatus Krumholzibacteriaceae bacterium]|nr:2-C-methyl-D-erythritol 2,4-cyclodiphosphate synthase [Candidatus Krumholzibacteriaceae bacterium]